MRTLLTRAPAMEPVSLADVKSELARSALPAPLDDTLLSCLITAARIVCEARTGLLFLTQAWTLRLDARPPSGTIKLPIAPVCTLKEVRMVHEDGRRTRLDAGRFRLESNCNAQRLRFLDAEASAACAGSVTYEVDVVAGLAPRPADLPETLKRAVAGLAAHWHAQKQPIAFGDQTIPVPDEIAAVLDRFSRGRKLQPAA